MYLNDSNFASKFTVLPLLHPPPKKKRKEKKGKKKWYLFFTSTFIFCRQTLPLSLCGDAEISTVMKRVRCIWYSSFARSEQIHGVMIMMMVIHVVILLLFLLLLLLLLLLRHQPLLFLQRLLQYNRSKFLVHTSNHCVSVSVSQESQENQDRYLL